MNLAEDIKLAVERTAGFPVRHLHSSPVVETFNGKTVWEGMVEVYRVSSQPVSTAYGWAVDDGSGQPQFVTVLGTPPINGPLDAVRAWLVSLTRK
jgi:hypothetical protein